MAAITKDSAIGSRATVDASHKTWQAALTEQSDSASNTPTCAAGLNDTDTIEHKNEANKKARTFQCAGMLATPTATVNSWSQSLIIKEAPIVKKEGSLYAVDLNKDGVITDDEKLIDANGNGAVGDNYDFLCFLKSHQSELSNPELGIKYIEYASIIDFENPIHQMLYIEYETLINTAKGRADPQAVLKKIKEAYENIKILFVVFEKIKGDSIEQKLKNIYAYLFEHNMLSRRFEAGLFSYDASKLQFNFTTAVFAIIAFANEQAKLPGKSDWKNVGLATVPGAIFLAYQDKIFEIKAKENIEISSIKEYCSNSVYSKESIQICDNEKIFAEYYYYLGAYHLFFNNQAKALDAYNKALSINKLHLDALLNRGAVHQILGEYDEAIKDFKAYLSIYPQDINYSGDCGLAYLNLGSVYKKIGNYKLAIETYKSLIKQDANNVLAYLSYGNFCYELAQSTSAFKQNKQQAINADSYYNIACFCYTKLLSLNDRLNKLTKEQIIEAHFNLGNIYRMTQQYDLATEQFTKVLNIDIRHCGALNNIGAIYIIKQEYDKAKLSFNKVIELYPEDPKGYINLSNIYYSTGEPNLAKELYKNAIAKYPNNAQFYYRFGELYHKLGVTEKSIEYIKQALSCYAKLLSLKKGELNKLTKKQIIEVHLNYCGALNNLGAIYAIKKDYDNAVLSFNKVMKLYPEDPKGYMNLSNIYYSTGEPNLAIKLFDNAIKKYPNNAQFYYYLGELYYKLGNAFKAIECINLAVQQHPKQYQAIIKNVPEDIKSYIIRPIVKPNK